MAKGKAQAEPETVTAEEPLAEDAKFEAYLERLTKIAEDAAFESGTLVGDLRDALLAMFKERDKPWSQHSESQQRDLGRMLENAARTFLRKAVIVVAEQDSISVQATLKGHSVKGDVFAIKAEARGDVETAAQLFNMDGHAVVIMSADAERFGGQRKDVEVEEDAPALPFSDEPPAEEVDLEEAAEVPAEMEEAEEATAEEGAGQVEPA